VLTRDFLIVQARARSACATPHRGGPGEKRKPGRTSFGWP